MLAGIPDSRQRSLVRSRLVSDDRLVPMSLFQRFYLSRALEKLDAAEAFFPRVLAPWREMLANGLGTWQENVDPSRSDCHAWASWIVVDSLAMVLGIRAGSPAWKTIRVEPRFAAARRARGSFPTPAGTLSVDWERSDDGRLRLEIHAPPRVPVTVALPGQPEQHFSLGGRIVMDRPDPIVPATTIPPTADSLPLPVFP